MSSVLIDLKEMLENIRFDERFYSEEEQEWTYYFIAPAQMILEAFPGKYDSDKVVSTEISMSFHREQKYEPEIGELMEAYVSISPTLESEDDGYCIDYDWTRVDVSDGSLTSLVDIGMREAMTFKEYWDTYFIKKDLHNFDNCDICNAIYRGCKSDIPFNKLALYPELAAHAKQLYFDHCKGVYKEGMVPFKVHITEALERNVVIYAKNKEEAQETAEYLCNEGTINLDSNDFQERYVEVIEKVEDADRTSFEIYTEEDE